MRKKGSYHKNRPFRLLAAAALRFVRSYLNDIALIHEIICPRLEKLTVSFSRRRKGRLEMADVLAVRDEYRAQQWAMVVQECRSSGMTNREYCRQRGISEKSFYYWQRKFRTQIVASAAPQLVQLEAVPVTEEVLQIQYRGAELRLPARVDMDAVSALLCSIQSL